MWKAIRREFSVNRDSLWQSGLILFGICLLGEVVSCVLQHVFSDDPGFIPMGMILASFTAFTCAVIFPAYYFSCGYEQALTMGCTRGRFLAGALALSFCHIALLMLFSGAAAFVDVGFYRVFYPQIYAKIDWAGFWTDFPLDISVLGALGVLALGAAGLVCVGLFFGACVQRWGKRAFWILYGVIMATMFLAGPLSHLREGVGKDSPLGQMMDSLDRVLARLPVPAYLWLGGAALLAAGVFGAVLLLRGGVRRAT